MAFNKNLEEVWRWKEEVLRETENLTAEEQLNYFHKVSQEFLDKSIPLEVKNELFGRFE